MRHITQFRSVGHCQYPLRTGIGPSLALQRLTRAVFIPVVHVRCIGDSMHTLNDSVSLVWTLWVNLCMQ